MKRFRFLILVMAIALTATTARHARGEDAQPSFDEQLQQSLPRMGGDNIPERHAPQQKLQEMMFQLSTPGREAELAAACKTIAAKLGPDVAAATRIWLLKQLEFNGRAECVDAVAAVLGDRDPHVRDAARRALQNNPAPEANTRLLEALAKAKNSTEKVAFCNSLGYRGDENSIDALANSLADKDENVAAAAANALGKIGSEKAARALAAAEEKATGVLQVSIGDAYLRCADRELAAGHASKAADMYDRLCRPEKPRTVRLAAIQGKLNAAGDKAMQLTLGLIQSEDADQRAIAAGHVETLLGGGAMKTSPESMAKMPPQTQILLLSALAAQADRSSLPLATAALTSRDGNVRVAAIRAVGALGDANSVPALVEFLAKPGEQSEAARESLIRLAADRVDETIVAALENADSDQQRTIIDVLSVRKATVAAAALMKLADGQDAVTRQRAIAALGELAESKYVGDMARMLLAAPKGREREDIAKAIMFICNRIPEESRRADPVLDQLSRVGDEQKLILLPVAGRVGGAKALEAVQSALKSEDEATHEAGVRALCNWPDASVAGQLQTMAKSGEHDTHRVWALRAYVRVVTLPSDRAPQQTLDMLKKAWELSARDDERRLILSRAASARCVETLRWVASQLDNAALAPDACVAVVELAHHKGLREPNRRDFDPALKKVIQTCRDRELTARAKRYLEGLP